MVYQNMAVLKRHNTIARRKVTDIDVYTSVERSVLLDEGTLLFN